MPVSVSYFCSCFSFVRPYSLLYALLCILLNALTGSAVRLGFLKLLTFLVGTESTVHCFQVNIASFHQMGIVLPIDIGHSM